MYTQQKYFTNTLLSVRASKRITKKNYKANPRKCKLQMLLFVYCTSFTLNAKNKTL